MNEQLLKDFIATAEKYNYDWNVVFGKFPELQGYDQQLLKDYAATAKNDNYNYTVVNAKFPEFGFGGQQQSEQPQYNKFSYQAIPEQEAAPTLGQQVQASMEQIMPGLQQKREDDEQAKKNAESNAMLSAMKKADGAKDFVKKKAAQDAALREMGFGPGVATESVSVDGSSVSPELPRMPLPGEQFDLGVDNRKGPYEFSGEKLTQPSGIDFQNYINRDKGLPYNKFPSEIEEEAMAELKKKEEEESNEAAKRSSELNRAVNALPAFNTLVNSIDANLIGKEEEDIISRLDFQFGRFGFIFSESGIGDAITVKTSDGLNGIEIQLDNWSEAQDSAEGERLKEFIREFSRMPKSIELAKKQENLSPVELEADAFYQSRGLNYFEEKDKWETYTRLRDEIEFIKEDMAGEKTLEEEKQYPNLYVNGKLRTDIEQRLGQLERQRDGLFESVFDAGFIDSGKIQKTREDFDVHLNKLSEAQAKQAADLNTIAQTKEFEVQTAAYEQFGVGAKDLFNITPKNEQEANTLKSLQDAYYSSQVEKDFASRKYDMAKTYFDGKINKEISGEYTENWDAFVAQAQSGYANGKAAEQILAISMGVKDVNDPYERAKAIAIIVDNMRRAEELSNKQSRVLDRTNSSVGWKEWSSAVAADPFEWATSLAAHSISEMLPYGSKIVPTTIAAGAAGGAAFGATAGGVGALPGAITGAGYGLKTGMAAAGFAMEYTNAIFDAMRNKGYDLTDPAQVEMAMADQEVWKEGGKVGTLRGIPIATMDLLSAGIAGRVFKVSKLAALPTKIAVGTAERMVFDPAAEAAGEFLAQVSAGQKIDLKEIAAEAGGAMGNNTSNMAVNMYKDARNKTNIQFADNLTKIGFLSSENATDTRITSWANNMLKLGKIDADVNQRIQENVGLRRDARDILSIGTLGRYVNRSSETVNRVMELLAARQELSSTTNRRELNRAKITAINDEITAISETKALLPQEQSVDLSLIIGTTRRGTSQYIIDGKRLTKDEFNYRLGKMSPEKVAKLDSEGKIIIRQDTDAMAAVQDAMRRRGSRVNTPEEVVAEVTTETAPAVEVTTFTTADEERRSMLQSEVDRVISEAPEGVPPLTVKINDELISFDDAQKELETLNQKANAVQEQTTSEVPIQSEAGFGEEVERGTPTTEPQVTTEEGKNKINPETGVLEVGLANPPTVTIETEAAPEVDEESLVEYNPKTEDIRDQDMAVLSSVIQSKKLKPQAEPQITDFGDTVVFEYNDLNEGADTWTRLTFKRNKNGTLSARGVKVEKNVSTIRGSVSYQNYIADQKAKIAPAPAVETAPAPAPTVEVVAPTVEVVAPTVEVTPTTSPVVTLDDVVNQQLEGDMVQAQAEIDDANEKIAEIQEEIAIEKSNTKDEIAEVKDKIAKIKARNLPKKVESKLIQELKDDLANFKEGQENQIGIYNEDLAEQKAALRKAEAKLKKLEAKKAQAAPAPTPAPKAETKSAPVKREYITMSEIRQRFPLAAEYIELIHGKKDEDQGVGARVLQNLLLDIYQKIPTAKKTAVALLDVIKQVEALAEELNEDVKKVTKAQFKKQLVESGDFNVKQLRILNALVDSLQTDVMPEYIVRENVRILLGGKSKNFYMNAANRIVSREADAFMHEIGHFGFFRILTGADRVKFFEYMIESTYGKKGTPLKQRLAFTSSPIVGIGPKGKPYGATTNVADNFAEYFAEQFSQWYMNERMVPAEIDTLFEKIAKFYNLVIEKLKSGKYVDKNLSEYFNKISAKIEQKRAINAKKKKATAPDPELSESVQELEENLGLDFEDEFGLDDELSPMNRNFDSPLVQMAKMYNMKESGFFQNNVSTSHVNRDFYQFGLEAKQSAAGTYYLVDIGTKKMVNPFKTKRGGGNNTANMARKITDINKKRTTAKNNVKSKIGVAQAIAPDLNRLFSVNPRIIPEAVFDKYMALLDGFTGRAKVLTPPEITAATANVQAVLAALDADISQVESLAIRMDNYTNKVFDASGNLDFDATITNMKDDGTITEPEYKLMKKHKKRIMPKVSKPKMTAAEEKVIKDQLIKDIKSLVIKISGLATRFERNAAKKFENLLTDEMLEKLSISRLSNILKLIDNINNGYFPHYAQLTINRLQGIKEGMNLANSIRNVDPLKVSKFISSIKAKLMDSDALLEMIRRTPLFFIDQAFGDFKNKTIYNAVFQPVASAYSSFKVSIDRINNKLDKAHDRVAKSYKYNGNKILESSFRMMTYMIQLEFESNPASKQVNPAAEYLKATINKRNSMYGEAETKMLQGILDKYGVVIGQDKNGNDIIGIDNQALYASFNNAEKAALKTIREINDDMTETAQHTASVIRGKSIDPLNNYVHLRVMTDMNPEDAATATILSSAYSNSLRPSTKAKNLEERTAGAKAINFDVYGSAQSGAKSTLLDFFMTDAVRTVRGTISEATRMLEEGPKMTKEQSAALDAVNNVFEEVLKNVLSNSFSVDSLGDMVTGEIVKQGYRAVLASTQKFAAELLSNLSYVAAHPQEFAAGLAYAKYIMSSAGPDIMMNVDSSSTNRTYNGESLSGRLVDTSAMSQSSGVKSARAKSTVRNVSNMIYNLTLKKYKNSIEVMADALISTPDKVIMRPVWFGAFANEFKNQTGVEVDFDKIAENDEAYMQDNADAIAAARNAADEQSVLMGATNNPFMAVTKGTAKPDMTVSAKLYNNFNNYMTTFQVFEFNAARQGIYAAMGNGTMSRARGAALLAACMLRMTTYTMLSGLFAGGLIGLMTGKKDDDDDEKTIGQKATQATISTLSGLLLGRDLGNASKTFINYAVEKGNQKYLDGLRKEGIDPETGEMGRPYDPYKDQIAYSVLPREGSSTDFGDMMMTLTGSSSPMFKTAKLAFDKWYEDPKKEPAAIERQKREIQQRIPLEILGNIGLVPLYKEVRKAVIDNIYESLKDEKEQELINAKEEAKEKKRLQGYESRSDMERYNPKLYEQTFGPSSPDYAEDEAKREAARIKNEAKQSEKDKKFGYDPNRIPTMDEMSRSELKRYFPEEYDKKYGKGSPTYAEDEAEKAVNKYERDQRQAQLDAYYGYSTKPKNEVKEEMQRERDAMRGEFNEERRRMRREAGL